MWFWLGFTYVIAILVMFVLWLFAKKTSRADYVDLGWTLGLMIAAWIAGLSQTGPVSRRLIIIGAVTFWGFRLGSLLLKRLRNTTAEDPRYQRLRETWGSGANARFFIVFQVQALLVAFLAWPFFLATSRQNPAWDLATISGLCLWLIGMAGESLADAQLEKHKKEAPAKTICERGLWRYSRHPNYFFEWVMWIAYFTLALPHPWGITAIISPAIMYVFLRWVTGVPPAEEQSLRSRGEAYVAYQRRTSVFFPLPPRSKTNV